MRDAIGLDRLKPLEEEKRQEKPVAGRITVIDGDDVGARGEADFRVGGKRLVANLAKDLLWHLVRGQLERNPIGQR